MVLDSGGKGDWMRIGTYVSLSGWRAGTVVGIERAEDESVVGLVLKLPRGKRTRVKFEEPDREFPN